jgi:hypothetical protein
MSRLKKLKSPRRAKLGAKKNDRRKKKGKSPWRAKLGAKKRKQKRLKQKKHDQVKSNEQTSKAISHW